uniref:Nuclear protein p8 n=1 Tax=Paracalanus parvus TaxID=187406 RepID=A0A0U2VAB3_9MAXI|nr:nuclear protein p8 [Paracalanus parvus]
MSDNEEQYEDKYEHYNYDQDKAMMSGHSGKQRSKKEAEMNTNRHNAGGHERKITTKLQNMEKNVKAAEAAQPDSGKNKP